MTFLSSSYRTSTKAPPMPLSTLDQAPLKKALAPSSRTIFLQQSRVPVYMMSATGEEMQIYRDILPFLFMHTWWQKLESQLHVVVVTSFASRLHHHASTNSVKGVGHESGDGGHALSNHPAHDNVCVLGVRKHSCKINVTGNVTKYFRIRC